MSSSNYRNSQVDGSVDVAVDGDGVDASLVVGGDASLKVSSSNVDSSILLLEKILLELKKINLHMACMTDLELYPGDVKLGNGESI